MRALGLVWMVLVMTGWAGMAGTAGTVGRMAAALGAEKGAGAGAGTGPAGREIVGYVFPQETVLAADAVDAGKLTRVNYAFANIAQGRMVAGFPHDSENLATLTALRGKHPALKVLVSVGGWLWSGGFSDVALTEASRRMFIESVVAFVEQHQLDGLDVDWEYPGMPGAGHRFRAADKQNYTLLLRELRARFVTAGAAMHRRLYLTIAAGSSGEWLEHTEMARVAEAVDTVNLMAYDYYEPGGDRTTGNHAPLLTDPADPKQVSADASVRAMLGAGVPAGKLVLGVPFYGHAWGHVSGKVSRQVAGQERHGLFAPGQPVQGGGDAPYSRIAGEMLPAGFTRYWDAASKVPWLYSKTQQVFVSYEDAESLTAKCAYVKSHGLAGIMFWEYTNDPSGVLLGAVARALR